MNKESKNEEAINSEILGSLIGEIEARRVAGDREARLVITIVGNEEPFQTLLSIAGNPTFDRENQEYPTYHPLPVGSRFDIICDEERSFIESFKHEWGMSSFWEKVFAVTINPILMLFGLACYLIPWLLLIGVIWSIIAIIFSLIK